MFMESRESESTYVYFILTDKREVNYIVNTNIHFTKFTNETYML